MQFVQNVSLHSLLLAGRNDPNATQFVIQHSLIYFGNLGLCKLHNSYQSISFSLFRLNRCGSLRSSSKSVSPTNRGPQKQPIPASIISMANIEAYGTFFQHDSPVMKHKFYYSHFIAINSWLLQCDCTSRTGCREKSPVHPDLNELSFTVSIQHAQTQFNISYPSLIIEVERLTKHSFEFDLCCLFFSTMTCNLYSPILPISRVKKSLFATSCLVRLGVE